MLAITILIIAGLGGILSGLSVTILKDIRNEFLAEAKEQRKINHEQDLCLKSLEAETKRIDDLQKQRLERERRSGVK